MLKLHISFFKSDTFRFVGFRCEDNCMLTRTLKIHGKVETNTMETHSYFIQNVG